ncbi:hypothetical protein [Alishewanella longhuensis]
MSNTEHVLATDFNPSTFTADKHRGTVPFEPPMQKQQLPSHAKLPAILLLSYRVKKGFPDPVPVLARNTTGYSGSDNAVI